MSLTSRVPASRVGVGTCPAAESVSSDACNGWQNQMAGARSGN